MLMHYAPAVSKITSHEQLLNISIYEFAKNITLKAPFPIYLPDHHCEKLKKLVHLPTSISFEGRDEFEKKKKKKSVKNSW